MISVVFEFRDLAVVFVDYKPARLEWQDQACPCTDLVCILPLPLPLHDTLRWA